MSDGLSIAMVCFASFGGSGIIATELAVGLAKRGHRVHVIASAPPSRALPECDRLFFHEVTGSSYPSFQHLPYTLPLAGTIVDVANEHGLDLLHVHYAVPHAASAYLARQTLGPRAPMLVTTLHGTDVTRLGSEASYGAVTRFSVEASDGITLPSEFLRGEARRSLGFAESTPIEVIPNFVDTDRFAPVQERDPRHFDELFSSFGPEGEAPAGPTLFHVSNFRAVKRVSDLIDVLARVRARFPARLVLVGDGPERALAAARARDLGLQKQVCFLGKRADFVEHLRNADAFLFPSETESFGLAALEALSCGVPVFGYRIGGLPEVVTSEVGQLVPPFDVDALATAVTGVLENPSEREAKCRAARARVLAKYRHEPAIASYERFYERTLAKKRGMIP